MIAIKFNAADVKAAFREIARFTPAAARSVIRTVGMAIRKDVRTSIEGKGPVPAAPQKQSTIRYKGLRGIPRRQGGGLSDAIYTTARPGKVFVGTRTNRISYFQKYQRGTYGGPMPRRRSIGIFMFYDETSTDPLASGEIWKDYRRNREGFPMKLGLKVPAVVARPIIQPLAAHPGLAARIRDVATKRLASMARQAARKAARAA